MLQVRDWRRNFETAEGRKYKALNWVALPNDLQDIRYRMLVDHPDGAAHFGAWVAILEVASTCKPRGTLADGGVALAAKHLALKSGMPEAVFGGAIPRLLELGWLDDVTGVPGESPETPGESPGAPGENLLYGNGNGNDYEKDTLSEEWESFRSLYPEHRFDEERALREWRKRDDRAAIIEGLKRHLESEEWKRDGGRYVPNASKFIREGLYKLPPVPAAAEPPSRYREWNPSSDTPTQQSTMDPETRRLLDERRASVTSTMDPETARRIREARGPCPVPTPLKAEEQTR